MNKLSRISLPSRLKLVSLILLSFLLAGCPCPPCVRPTLPTEPHPFMQEVVTNDEGGLDAENSLRAVSNIFSYQGALEKCNETIRLYNQTVKNSDTK